MKGEGFFIPIFVIVGSSSGTSAVYAKDPKKQNAPCKSISAYACFIKEEKAKLSRTGPQKKLCMTTTNQKWKDISSSERNKYEDIAKACRYPSATPECTREGKLKCNETKRKARVDKKEDEEDIPMTNREFVDTFDGVNAKVEELSDQNKKLIHQIQEMRLKVLSNSHILNQKIESDAMYKARFHKLSIIHEKCNQ